MGFGLLANSLPQNLNIGYWLAWKCRWKDILISEKLAFKLTQTYIIHDAFTPVQLTDMQTLAYLNISSKKKYLYNYLLVII